MICFQFISVLLFKGIAEGEKNRNGLSLLFDANVIRRTSLCFSG